LNTVNNALAALTERYAATGSLTPVAGRAMGGTGLPGVPYRTHQGEIFTPDQRGRFSPDPGGSSGITINFNGSGGPASAEEAEAYGHQIGTVLQMYGITSR
jgi:hypothetical protein